MNVQWVTVGFAVVGIYCLLRGGAAILTFIASMGCLIAAVTTAHDTTEIMSVIAIAMVVVVVDRIPKQQSPAAYECVSCGKITGGGNHCEVCGDNLRQVQLDYLDLVA